MEETKIIEEQNEAPRKLAIPGDKIAEGMDYVSSSGTYRAGNDIYSCVLGLVDIRGRVVKVIPFAGVYQPQVRDLVIGKVMDVGYSFWLVDIDGSSYANLNVRDASASFIPKDADLTRYFDIGDMMVAEIVSTNKTGSPSITCRGPGLRKITSGIVIKISPFKVPRLIGRKGSMISMIKEYTNTEVTVGQNGWVWVRGEAESMLVVKKAIELIEEKGHIHGLTDKIKELLEREKK